MPNSGEVANYQISETFLGQAELCSCMGAAHGSLVAHSTRLEDSESHVQAAVFKLPQWPISYDSMR